MMGNIIIGRYVPGNSLLHSLDPRAKLLGVFLFVLIVFLANNSMTYAVLGIFSFSLLFLSRVPFIFLYRGLKPIVWIIVFTMFFHFFMTKEGTVVLDLNWFKIYSEGIKQGVFLSLRLLYLIMVSTLLTLTTTPLEITDGIENLLSPFKRFGVPAHELALMMSISLRFIPTLMDETEKIVKAQSSRGVDFADGSLKEKMQGITSLLIPLFISAFRRAEELAVAMEARGYRGGEGRTRLREFIWKRRDTFSLVTLFLFALLLLFLRS